jgi:peptide/nickel transport system substrate-binding protein
MRPNITNLGYPAEHRIGADLSIVQPVFETLGRYNEKGELVPWLAEKWESDPENNTVTYYLKKGIQFHDGTDFNAEAVKWNIEAYQEAQRAEVNGIKSIDVLDDYTVRLNLEEWNYNVLDLVAYYVKMVSPTAVQEHGKEWAVKNPVGTGPFVLESWERDASVRFVRNENYWIEGQPYVDAIEYILISGAGHTAANVFKAGDADILSQVDPEDYIEMEQSGQYIMRSSEGVPGAVSASLAFDSANPDSPFHDLKVRQAVIHAVDSEAIINSVLRGLGVYTNQWAEPSSPFYNPEVQGYPYDPERARQLLAEAGYPNGFKTQITTYEALEPVMVAVQGYLAEVGIQAEVNVVDFARWAELIGDRWEGMIVMIRWLAPNISSQMDRLLSKDGAVYVKNMIHPEEVEEALAKARTAHDAETYRQAVLDAQKVIIDDYALYFSNLIQVQGAAVMPYVHNDGFFTTNFLDWYPESVWLEEK